MRAIIIDDERLARKELNNLLKNYPEVEIVDQAVNADEALEKIKRLHPDLIFLDIQMPGKTGFELLEELEKDIPEVTKSEQNNMISAIAQKLAESWEQEVTASNSNFMKSVVKVEFSVNSDGFIVSKIRALKPRQPKGNYLLAFNLAGKAIMRANPLPIIPNKYPNGITFEILFDPEKGFSF